MDSHNPIHFLNGLMLTLIISSMSTLILLFFISNWLKTSVLLLVKNLVSVQIVGSGKRKLNYMKNLQVDISRCFETFFLTWVSRANQCLGSKHTHTHTWFTLSFLQEHLFKAGFTGDLLIFHLQNNQKASKEHLCNIIQTDMWCICS